MWARLSSSSKGTTLRGSSKGYAYSEQSLSPVFESLEKVPFDPKSRPQHGVAFKPINEHWCLSYCSASVENAGLGIELTHCCLRKEQWYEQTRTAALQCPRESENSPAPFAGRQSGVGFMRTAPDHSQPVLSMAEAVFRERHAGL